MKHHDTEVCNIGCSIHMAKMGGIVEYVWPQKMLHDQWKSHM